MSMKSFSVASARRVPLEEISSLESREDFLTVVVVVENELRHNL